MARFTGMTPIEATSKIIGDRYEAQLKQVTIKKNDYYNEIKAWEYSVGTYERDMYENFISSVEYAKYINE